jgi:hypothetical protein
MKIISTIPDNRILASNVLVELSYEEYLDIAKKILSTNEFQRKKVIKGVVRKMLKSDLLVGCTFPPIVLAVPGRMISKDFEYKNQNQDKTINKAFEDQDFLLIDGLQRSHVLLELEEEIKGTILEQFKANRLRVEILIGLSRINILYRMLTLNTGQTTMSTRHLMEIMYTDYGDSPIGDIELVKDKSDTTVDAKNPNQFKFKEVLDGFNSFLEKKEVTIQRSEILDNINAIENMKDLNKDKDVFNDFVETFHKFLTKVDKESNHLNVTLEDFDSPDYELKNSSLFGKTYVEFFKKSQALSGFGAAIKTLQELRGTSFDDVKSMIDKISVDDYEKGLLLLNKHFDYLKENSKKIGNDQRFYFLWFFRKLFDIEYDHKFDFVKTVEFAFQKTREEKYS